MSPSDATRVVVVYDPGTLVRARMPIEFVTHGARVEAGARGTVRRSDGLAGLSVVYWNELGRELATSNDSIEPVPS